jgi:hypothetical protein
MPMGEGKYDALCTVVREAAKAKGAIVIVIEGEYGSGFSLQTDDPILALKLPGVLELVASQMREDFATGNI